MQGRHLANFMCSYEWVCMCLCAVCFLFWNYNGKWSGLVRKAVVFAGNQTGWNRTTDLLRKWFGGRGIFGEAIKAATICVKWPDHLLFDIPKTCFVPNVRSTWLVVIPFLICVEPGTLGLLETSARWVCSILRLSMPCQLCLYCFVLTGSKAATVSTEDAATVAVASKQLFLL